MEKPKLTNLTDNAVQQLHKNIDQKMEAAVQLLGIEKSPYKDDDMHFDAILSDGSFKEKFLINPRKITQFKEQCKNNDVILCQLITRKNINRLFKVLIDFSVVGCGIDRPIGNPIWLDEDNLNRENPEGDTLIPQHHSQEANEMRKLSEVVVQNEEQKAPTKNAPVERLNRRVENVKRNEYISPIDRLTPDYHNWSIRARVISKSDIKYFTSRKGTEGQVFNAVIKDSGKAIQCSFFGKACEKFYDMLQVKGVYIFRDGRVTKGGNFNRVDNEYVVTFNDDSVIEPDEDDGKIPSQNYDFFTVKRINEVEGKKNVNVMGVVHEVDDLRQIKKRDGSGSIELLNIQIKDDSNYALKIGFWGENATKFNFKVGEIVAFEQLYADNSTDFKKVTFGRYASKMENYESSLRYKELKQWVDSGNNKDILNSNDFGSQSKADIWTIAGMCKDSSELLLEDEDMPKPRYYTIIADLTQTSMNLSYDGCPTEGCKKKVLKENDTYFCAKCNAPKDGFKRLFFSNIRFTDMTGTIPLMCSGDEQCQLFLNTDVDTISNMREESESDYRSYIRKRLYQQFVIRVAAKKNIYNDTTSVRFSVVKAYPLENQIDQVLKAYTETIEEIEKKMSESGQDNKMKIESCGQSFESNQKNGMVIESRGESINQGKPNAMPNQDMFRKKDSPYE